MDDVKIYENVFENFSNKQLDILAENYLKISEISNFIGEPEKHLNYIDVYIILEGSAIFYYGKKLVSEFKVSEGEYRGKEIKNPRKVKLEKNTVVIIPANVAHKMDVHDKVKLIVLKLKQDVETEFTTGHNSSIVL